MPCLPFEGRRDTSFNQIYVTTSTRYTPCGLLCIDRMQNVESLAPRIMKGQACYGKCATRQAGLRSSAGFAIDLTGRVKPHITARMGRAHAAGAAAGGALIGIQRLALIWVPPARAYTYRVALLSGVPVALGGLAVWAASRHITQAT